MKGFLLQLQPFSVNDGNGIRTTIFLAGCPLRCKWCSNPEGFSQEKKIGFYEKLCIGCGACKVACPLGIDINLNGQGNRSLCVACGACVAACPKHARREMVQEIDALTVINEVKKYRLFYQKSGGGVTFSGGEATLQKDFLEEVSSALYDMGIQMALETCGFFDFEALKPILLRMDLIFIDLKHMNRQAHAFFTGASNEKILDNIPRLKELKAEVVVRIPIIEGVNDTEENIRASARFIRENLPKGKIELLPYHKLGFGKYEALGMELPSERFATVTKERMELFRRIIGEENVEITDFK